MIPGDNSCGGHASRVRTKGIKLNLTAPQNCVHSQTQRTCFLLKPVTNFFYIQFLSLNINSKKKTAAWCPTV